MGRNLCRDGRRRRQSWSDASNDTWRTPSSVAELEVYLSWYFTKRLHNSFHVHVYTMYTFRCVNLYEARPTYGIVCRPTEICGRWQRTGSSPVIVTAIRSCEFRWRYINWSVIIHENTAWYSFVLVWNGNEVKICSVKCYLIALQLVPNGIVKSTCLQT